MGSSQHELGFDGNGSLEPLAVVGMSFRLPAGAETDAAFWEMLVSKQNVSTETPLSRFNINAHHHNGPQRVGSMSYRGGHFLAGDPIDTFDAQFFSTGANEAQATDPVHRIMLETSYRALENAGISMEEVSGTKTAVFAASSSTDYSIMMSKDPDDMAKYTVTGTSANMMANRISWFFNLNGPSASVSAACSSSLVALDMACQTIWSKNATMALACGGNLIITPEGGMWLDNLGMLSKDSRCFTLDKRANGFARGEGFGALVIKPVSAAIRDGDTIRALIRSTHSNSNGKTAGLTQPSQEAQYNLILETYEKAGLSLASTRYFEAHGTGTALGDPTEFNAIGAAFKQYRSPEEPLYVGSVKSNIGHLEGASGIAGVIKAILMLEKGAILPNANFVEMNPKINAKASKIAVADRAITWPDELVRRVSVQSFGFGGSNSHVILDGASSVLRDFSSIHNQGHLSNGIHGVNDNKGLNGLNHVNGLTGHNVVKNINGVRPQSVSRPQREKLLVWSSEDEGGMSRIKESWKQYFDTIYSPEHVNQQDNRYLANLAYTLASRRSHLRWRSFAVATDSTAECMVNITSQMSKAISAVLDPKLAFIFTGQGSQWYAMGRGLLDRYEFKKSLTDASAFFQSLGCKWDVIDELSKDESRSSINDPLYSQPLCTTLQVALVELLKSFGIRPSAVVGHSSGEIAAAYAKGAISRESAWKISYWRGFMAAQLVKRSSTKGSMMAVGLSAEQSASYLKEVESELGSKRLVVACINSPTGVTIAGDIDHLEHLRMALEKVGGIFCRKLKVNVAYHSFQMREVMDQYLAKIDSVETGSDIHDNGEAVLMVSSVTGSPVASETLCTPQYWGKNLVSPVLFSDALTAICNLRSQDSSLINAVLEIGPHSALRAPSEEIIRATSNSDIFYVPSMIRNISAIRTMLEAVGTLHCLGFQVDLAYANKDQAEDELKNLTSLPEYSFNHAKSYWHESRISKGYRLRRFPWHPLVGIPDSDWNPFEAKWRHPLRLAEQAWVEDHKINGIIVLPAAAMFVMVIEAAKQLADPSKELQGFNFKDTNFHSVFKVSTKGPAVEANLHLVPRSGRGGKELDTAWYDFRLYTHDSDTNEWQEKCHGSVQLVYATTEDSHLDSSREREALHKMQLNGFHDSLQTCTTKADINLVYAYFAELGYEFGPAFRPITSIVSDGHDTAIAEVRTHRTSADFPNHIIHPATLDGIFQTMFMAASTGWNKDFRLAIPSHFDHLWISSKGLSYPETDYVRTSGSFQRTGMRESCASIVAVDPTGSQVLVQIDGFRATDVASHSGRISTEDEGNHSAVSLCHTIHWKPDLDLISNDKIQDYCQDSVLLDPNTILEEVEFATDLDFLITGYIQKTMRALTSKIEDDLQSKNHTLMYLAWMKERMKLLEVGESHFSTPEWKNLLEDTDYVARTSKRVAATNPSGLLYTTVGDNLYKLLVGEMNSLDLLFSGELVKAYYYSKWDSLPAVKRFSSFLDALVHKNPNANILEIGAGTGATTVQLMETLTHINGEPCAPRFSHFDYTDVSPFFLHSAEQQFGYLGSKISFRKLNIESDPGTQGFVECSYDVVIAAAVIHATSDLTSTLSHCHKLLKPGGKLILWEGTVPNGLRNTFVFGLLEGWWLGSEPYRKWSPCIDENKWSELLQSTGFSGTDIVLRDFEAENSHEFSIMTSTALAIPTPNLMPTLEDIDFLVIYEPGQEALARSFANCWDNCPDKSAVRISPVYEATKDMELLKCGVKPFLVFITDLDRPIWHNLTSSMFTKLQPLLSSTHKILWVDSRDDNPEYSIMDGVSRVLNSEAGDTKLSRLSLNVKQQPPETQASFIMKLAKSLLGTENIDTEYVQEEDGSLSIPRLYSPYQLNDQIRQRTMTERKVRRTWSGNVPLRLKIGSPGLLDTLHFEEDETRPLRDSDVEIEVRSVGLNFKDVLVCLGSLDGQDIGCEVAGVVTSLGASAMVESGLRLGDRVASVVSGSYKTKVYCDWKSVASIPDGIDFSSAAAIPVNFVTAWHALHDVARLQSGETILIHSAAGGTGQAAIQIAQLLGAVVYATVGSEAKKSFLVKNYNITEDHIFSSRDVVFASSIKRLTHGKGVDVVLNSLSGDSLIASWESIAHYGRLIEIGKKDIMAHGSLPMRMFADNVSFSAVDINALNRDRPKITGNALKHILSLVSQGSLQSSYPLQVYGVAEIEDAFRTLQSGKAMGKIVVELRPDDVVLAVLKPTPGYRMQSDATYVIAGGLGGLGRTVADWLVEQGARFLIILSRSGGNSESAQDFVRRLTEKGARVETPICDISDAKVLKSTIDKCLFTMPPIKGCIQASMVLADTLFETMTYESWQTVTAPKIAGSWNLHKVLPKGMDFFVMFSSISGICGNRGQSNYAAGNTFQDGLARYRVANGEKGTALDLGPFYDIGWMAEKTSLQALYKQLTHGPVTKADLLALLDYFCNPESSRSSQVPCQTTALRVGTSNEVPFYLNKPMFRCLAANSTAKKENEPEGTNETPTGPSKPKRAEKIDFASIFQSAKTLATATEAVTEALTQKIATTLSLERHELDIQTPMHRYGVDSLVAVELRNWISKEICSDVPILEFMGSATIASIGKKASMKSGFRKSENSK